MEELVGEQWIQHGRWKHELARLLFGLEMSQDLQIGRTLADFLEAVGLRKMMS